MVFHTLVVEDVRAYLRTPFNLFLSCLDFCLCLESLLHGAIVELRAQQREGTLLVLRLVARLGVLNEDFLFLACVGIGIPIAQTHTRLHLVDVLSTGTRGTERVPRELGRVYIDLDGIVDKWRDEDRGKRGHALALGIERRHTHQTMHTIL